MTAADDRPTVQRRGRVGRWALGFAIAGLAAALFVGWAFPIALAGVALAIVSLRRPNESTAVAVWALSLGALALLYSAGWLVWAAGTAWATGPQ